MLLAPLALLAGGCAAVRENSLAQSAARAVVTARSYDNIANAMKSGDDARLRANVDEMARVSSQSGAALRLSSAEQAVLEAVRGEADAAQLPRAARLDALEQAAQNYRRALALSPDFPSKDPQLLNALGYFLADRGTLPNDFVLAEKLTRRSVQLWDAELKKNDVEALRAARATTLDSLAWALFRVNKLDEAEKQQREAIREARATNSLSAELPLHLADILAKAGKVAEARAAYQESLTLQQNEPDAHERAKAALEKLS
jgi:tetratricopeptide (TPR) repeat protein